MLGKSYSDLISSFSDISLETGFFIKSPFARGRLPATDNTYFTLSFNMSQNQNTPVGRKANINITLLAFRMFIVWKGKEEGVVKNRFALLEAMFLFP